MRTIAVLMIAAATLFGPLSGASAQDDEEEEAEGEDIDDLMATDPDRPDPEPEEDVQEQEAPPSGEEREGMSDDERPPGDEPTAEAEPKEEAVEADESSGPTKPISVGLLVGYGLALSDGANPWSAGFGLRGGYNVGGFYVGARFTYYVGETITVIMPSFSGDTTEVDVTANLWELGAEVGYDIRAGDIAVRPEFGVGFASVSANQTETVAYVAPGLALLFDVSAGFFLGVDARYQYVATALGTSGLGFFANIGMRF